jgi:hypothetical protein
MTAQAQQMQQQRHGVSNEVADQVKAALHEIRGAYIHVFIYV